MNTPVHWSFQAVGGKMLFFFFFSLYIQALNFLKFGQQETKCLLFKAL